MFLLFGTGSRQKEIGEFKEMPCFYCVDRQTMTLTKHFCYVHLFFIPIFHYNVAYYLTCSECGAVYLLEKEKAQQLCRNSATAVKTSDMTMIRQGRRQCPECGTYNPKENMFCSQCGSRL